MGQDELVRDRATALDLLSKAVMDEAAPQAAEAKPAEPVKRHRRRRTCQCGKCKVCIGNARWEIVFMEKFVDRDYYTGLRLTRRSPLTGF